MKDKSAREMAEMDRPDGLGVLWISAGAGLALLFGVVTLLAVVGKTTLLAWTGAEIRSLGQGDYLIPGLQTIVFIAAVVARFQGVRRVRMWMLTVLAGLTCGAWIAAGMMGGAGV